ncbi:MAG: hypothetical protein B7Z55_10150 [Planctomycetales bacterium 12-60-4]|nr:MAG: hypothetical protein B7Z55_10150 [Planctomycetales bacterium 12-60-4]
MIPGRGQLGPQFASFVRVLNEMVPVLLLDVFGSQRAGSKIVVKLDFTSNANVRLTYLFAAVVFKLFSRWDYPSYACQIKRSGLRRFLKLPGLYIDGLVRWAACVDDTIL